MSKEKEKPEADSGSKDSKKKFGSLKPLTAAQIVSLIVPSSPAGAMACY